MYFFSSRMQEAHNRCRYRTSRGVPQVAVDSSTSNADVTILHLSRVLSSTSVRKIIQFKAIPRTSWLLAHLLSFSKQQNALTADQDSSNFSSSLIYLVAHTVKLIELALNYKLNCSFCLVDSFFFAHTFLFHGKCAATTFILGIR